MEKQKQISKAQVSYRINAELYEMLREEAFKRRVDMVVIVEEALRLHLAAKADHPTGPAAVPPTVKVNQTTSRFPHGDEILAAIGRQVALVPPFADLLVNVLKVPLEYIEGLRPPKQKTGSK